MNRFKSTLLILPGLNNSGEGHWQTLWEHELGCTRVVQKDWDNPGMEDWIAAIEETVTSKNPGEVILVAHSLSCCSVAFWAANYNHIIRGAFLVGPSDTEAPTYPPGTSGFKPMPMNRLPFPSLVVASSDDYYVSLQRARLFADAWGSEFVNIGPAGHINLASGFGHWPTGLDLLRKFEQSLIIQKLQA
jgi:hypothetical protein